MTTRAKPQLSDRETLEMAEMFHLLGDPSRLRIALACLEEAVPVGEIAARLGLSQSPVSHHLRPVRAAPPVRAAGSARRSRPPAAR